MALAQVERTAFCTPSSGIAERKSAIENRAWRQDEGEAQGVAPFASLRALSGGVAHNFNNQLTVIIGNAALMRQELPPDSPVLSMLAQIESAAYRAENITRQMMLYAQRCAPRLELLNLSSLIEEVQGQFEIPTAGNVFVDYDLSPDRLGVSAPAGHESLGQCCRGDRRKARRDPGAYTSRPCRPRFPGACRPRPGTA
jgi:signal transduction histidine kinase